MMTDLKTPESSHGDPTPGPAPVPGYNPWTMALREEFQTHPPEILDTLEREGLTFELRRGKHSIWICARWPEGGGVAMRAGHCPDGDVQIAGPEKDGEVTVLIMKGAVGDYRLRLELLDEQHAIMRLTTSVIPKVPLTMPFWPSDIYPLDVNCDPTETEGIIYAAQRGTAGGLIYFALTKPESGAVLYMQDYTRLNPFFEKTETVPDARVGGRWPELGYTPPPFIDTNLEPHEEVILSDAVIRFSTRVPDGERDAARMFLQMLADVYPHLTNTEPAYHDWTERAKQTRHALESSPLSTLRDLGHLYLHPYVDAEYPDSMVQLSVLMALREYGAWKGEDIPLARELREGVDEFFDKHVGTVRRYLKTVGEDKNRDEVDSWYLYHPLVNLARLAAEGDEGAREMLLGSMDYAIQVAHHFQYVWPVQFDVKTLEVITGERKPGEPGQSDVPGLYAYLMLQVHDLTGEQRYLEEAIAAICSAEGLDFSIGYQFNNAAWGAVACIRLWRITGEEFFREQSELFLASFFHNTYLWESDLKCAKHYPTFLGVTCLHDGDYMAAYEEFEAFAAFHEYLEIADEEIRPEVRMLLSEYCRRLLDRGWYYYPESLPEDALATEIRNGHIERGLAIPLEDLYADGSPAGAVGQEIYGCGMAFAFVTRSYRHAPGGGFDIFCDVPVREWDTAETDCVSFLTMGDPQNSVRLRLIGDGSPVKATVRYKGEGRFRKAAAETTPEGHAEYRIPAGSRVVIDWSDDAT